MQPSDPLADLRCRFIDRSRERVARLRALLEEATRRHGPPGDVAPGLACADAIARLAHQLAGAAGTFGYAAVSEAAAALEDRARAAAEAVGGLDPQPLHEGMAVLETRMAALAATRA